MEAREAIHEKGQSFNNSIIPDNHIPAIHRLDWTVYNHSRSHNFTEMRLKYLEHILAMKNYSSMHKHHLPLLSNSTVPSRMKDLLKSFGPHVGRPLEDVHNGNQFHAGLEDSSHRNASVLSVDER